LQRFEHGGINREDPHSSDWVARFVTCEPISTHFSLQIVTGPNRM
jgi:hypothetical protein